MSRAQRRHATTVGTVIAGRYRLEQQLGEGGMAEVFRAEDLISGRRVAVKVLRRDIATNPEAVERTKREGELLSQLDNPAIVSVESWGQLEDGAVFLVMELLEGETLGERMRRGPLDPAELAPIVAGTCAGLHAAHARGVVHRDLKPDNIFLCPTDYGLQVKLLDFGISKVFGGQRLTQTGEVLGTPRYMSPEQLGAEPDVDGRVDVYALGVILYEALTGKPPFLSSTPTDLIIAIINGKVAPLRSLRPDVPPGVESVVMRALSKVRAARFDTAMAMAEAYIDAAGGVAAVRGAQRRGMATRALGGMLKAPLAPPVSESMPGTRPPPDPPGGDELAGNLRLGTFSGLEASPVPLEPLEPAKIDKRTAQMGASAGAPVPAAPGAPIPATPELESAWVAHAPTQEAPAVPPLRREMPKTRETPLGMADGPSPFLPAPESPRKMAATALMDPSLRERSARVAPAIAATPAAPTGRGGRVLLVVGALFAGAASAAAVIAALHFWDVYHREEESEQPAAPAPPSDEPESTSGAMGAPRRQNESAREGASAIEPAQAPAPDPVPPPRSGSEASAAPIEPAGASPTADQGAAPGEGSAPREARRRERRERESASDPPSAPALPGFGEGHEPADALREAQRALRSGDPQRCVEILSDAITQGAPTIALRRRADCMEAAGQREAAVRDYQRFCRLAPDHPSIADVRPLLESWGRSCP